MSRSRKAPEVQPFTPAEAFALAVVVHRGIGSDLSIGIEISTRWPNGESDDADVRARGRRIALQLVQAGELEASPRSDARHGHYYHLPAPELAAAA